MFSDIRAFFRRLLCLFRNDYTAIVLVVANIVPVKLTLDVFGHFAEHRMLAEPDGSLHDSNGH